MPILTNPKHELSAQGLAQGLSNRAAFAQAGYKPSDSTASHLANSDKIKARVDELIFALGNAGTPRMFVSLQALAGPSHSPVADTSARRSAPIMQSADVIACALAMHAPS
jgi:hypothetical protein